MTELLPAAASARTVFAPGAPAQAEPGQTAPASERRVRVRALTFDGGCALLGSAAGALALTWLLYERILPFSGVLGFWLLWYLLFLVFYGATTAMIWGRRAVADRVIAAVMATAGL